MKLETKFSLKDHVRIVPLKMMDGRVLSISISEQGTRYNVRWMTATEAKTGDFFEDELMAPPKPAPVGFGSVYIPADSPNQ